MNKDPILETLQAASASSAQRIVPQHQRYRWEQQWLRENRAASDVVDNGGGSHATTLAQGLQFAPHAAAPRDDTAAGQPIGTARPSAATAIGAGPPDNAADATAVRPTAGSGTPLPAPPWPPAATAMLDSARDAPPVAASALAARHRSALKQFALWRTDDEVRIALRIDESTQPATATLDALRQWLKDLRLKLASLTVNGSLRWQSRPKNTDGRY
jgi:hypothetical protein